MSLSHSHAYSVLRPDYIIRGRSFHEIDVLFDQRVPAWRFKTTKVELHATELDDVDIQDDDKATAEKA